MTNIRNPYRTHAGDMLDWICYQRYGSRRDAVDAVLDANPGLAQYGPVLPANIMITLPQLDAAADVEQVNLWD